MKSNTPRFVRGRTVHRMTHRAWFPFIVCCVTVIMMPSTAFSFWAQGHHAIAVLAFEQLSEEDQTELIRILKHHPRFEQDFKIPESIIGKQKAIHRWWIGVAGEWPDLIRGNETYDRPTWHYQLGATLVIGEVDHPEDPGPLPDDATLETRELYIVQAIELCRKIFRDKKQSDADRALAFCWLAHLVADAHQPCHAGSLYSTKAFPDGDRGANGIPVKVEGQPNIKNLHAFWDSLLGAEATPESVEERVARLDSATTSDDDKQRFWQVAGSNVLNIVSDEVAAGSSMDSLSPDPKIQNPSNWIEESRQIARFFVYQPATLEAVAVVERGLIDRPSEVKALSDQRVVAERIAHHRGRQSSRRLVVCIGLN